MVTKGTWYILGNGIFFNQESIEILPYLKLQKVSNLNVFDLAGLGAKGFREWSLIEPFCYCNNNFQIISSENENNKGYDILNRAWLLNTLLVLRKKTSIMSLAFLNDTWNHFKTLENPMIGLCDYHVNSINIQRINEPLVDEKDIYWISENFENTNHLAFKYDKFRYALEVINSWRYCIDMKSAIAIIWSAIESIVDVSSEITYRLSLNLSSILYKRGDERLNKFNEIKKLYSLRSKVIHGSNINKVNTEEALAGSFNLLSEILVYIIENNKMLTNKDFESAIFK